MLQSTLFVFHIVAAVVWVGGMFFAHQALRPAALQLEPALRLPLWRATFARFFPWVWLCVTLLPITGYAMMFERFGGPANSPVHVHIMQTTGWAMIGIFIFVFLHPYAKLKSALDNAAIAEAGQQLGLIRRWVGINLLLGLTTIAVAGVGR